MTLLVATVERGRWVTSPADQKYWANAHRRVALMQPDVAAALLRAYGIIRDALDESDLARIIDAGQLDALVTRVLSASVLDRAFLPFRLRLRETVQSSFRYTVPSLPKGGKVNGVLAVAFDTLSPNVTDALRTLDTNAVSALAQEVRDVVLARVENGIRDGVGPRVVAREIRGVVGLSPNMLDEIQNYREKLIAGESVTGYTLRDKRFKTATPEQIDRAVEAYRKRRIAQHAETIARTATLDAFKQGQRLAWDDAVEKGIVDGGRLWHQWIGVMDDRERPAHVAMEKETQPWGDAYSNGELVPGDSPGTYNCRCLDRVFVA